MAIDQDTLNRLPAAARANLRRTQDHTTPVALRSKFGPRLLLDAEDEENPYPPAPTRELAKHLVAHAEACQRTWLNIHDSHYRSLADRSVDANTAFLRSAKAARQQLRERDAEAHRLLDSVGEKLAHLDTVKANALKPPTSVGEAMVDAEMRAMIRAEKNPIRAAELAATHPRAVATAPSVASGLAADSELYTSMRDAHLRTAVPEAMAEQDELRDALDQFTRAGDGLEKFSRDLIDFDLADGLEKGASWEPVAA
ncbi:hypothetical protein [Pseudoxanthomonas sp. Soil82]|uniref:hypothetical protein n=1 Tax=Pseudoxanthomonas sp. Soil82 TaxID=3157341 RepID=UPI00338F18B4